jgi:hypothetical protein
MFSFICLNNIKLAAIACSSDNNLISLKLHSLFYRQIVQDYIKVDGLIG